MLSANQQKFLTSLQVKKYRQMYRKFLVEGDKMAAEVLSQSSISVHAVYATERWQEQHLALLEPYLEKFNLVSPDDLKKVSTLTTPNQVIVVADMPDPAFDAAWPATDWCLYLDGIQDPGNMGTLLRIADWFGFPAVICGPDTVDVFNPKVVQACMGALLRVPCFDMTLTNLLEQAPGVPVLGAALDGQPLPQLRTPGNGILVIGREGRGLSAETEPLLTMKATIPRHPRGGAESLNAAVAAGILAAAIRM